ncbi:MAG: hypothetical protein ACRC33_29260, partial [Gemmataceae bacterium]
MSVHPCGLAMDMLRSGYRGLMQTWQRDYPPVEVVWYRVPQDREGYEPATPFRSNNYTDDEHRKNDGVGEVYPITPDECENQRPWYNGAPPAIYIGGHPCGPRDAWLLGGVPGVTPVITTLPDGRCPS